MSRTASVVATTVAVTALVVAGTIGSLGSVIAFTGGGLVVLGAAVGRLRLALVPAVLGVGLAALFVMAPGADAGEWTPAIAAALGFLGLGGALCVAMGALIRRVAAGRPRS